ncbi:subtilase family protein [Sphingobacterium allocomposti]|uniref:Subtilase family protein n=1 Tax=Sphingobacterium allocomposti TaxID=415956 RepID=A0A5S5DGZ8_9SPHI|nr:S8 family peptidase [Sphingobacterium composti Yoo et al. 2007 non Ten et al. 2007]TYP94638.1 subtilase family protein [Sphingobacterium composti Yoo et al. 2007 non Ten et al. 2007]
MNHKLPHLYLRNPSGSIHKFNKSRAITDTKLDDKDPEAYRVHKQKLHASFVQLKQDRETRLQQKTLVPENLAIVEIRFLIPFSDGATFKTRTRFLNEFGLSPVMQKDFNRTVLFAIVDDVKFKTFDRLLNQYIESDNRTPPQGSRYAIMTTLYDVKYNTADDIRNNCTDDLVFEFINNNAYVDAIYETQRKVLDEYLDTLAVFGDIDSFTIDPYDKMVQIKGASREVVIEIAKNFDILAQAHSLRAATVKPDKFNTAQLTWGLNIRRNGNPATVIGILDNGIRPIDPIREVVLDGLDITTTGNALSAAHQHGTVVASLAAVGERYFTGENELIADAQVYSIKILENMDGYIDVIKVVDAIRNVHRTRGIRLFNLSVCTQSKAYNESPSLFAYLLDKLAYEEDILIFIAAGNMHYDDLVAMQEEVHDLHIYPNHFYNPSISSDIHSCEFTNICTPAESMNHITVGALADNYRPETATDLSHDKDLPAYYSRKNHYDFKQKINGGKLSPNHGNKNLFKPDLVMPGGDLLNDDGAMQVLGFGDTGTDYYTFDAGTSLATPLALNLAAQLINLYPNISLQSVKALMINSADSFSHTYLEDGVDKRKDMLAKRVYRRSFEDLNKGEKTNITKQVLSAEDIHRNIAGHGKPDREKLLYSSEGEVSLLIEDVIPTDHHKVVLVNIPEYLLGSANSKCLNIQTTLCFKINPAWGNHVDYNPLHISFNFANSVIKDSPDDLAAIIADRDHDFYKDSWTDEIRTLQRKKDIEGLSLSEKAKLASLKLKVKNQVLGVKTTVDSWSEDFFPLVNKPLSNRQQMSIILAKKDIQKIGNQLVIALRCAVKENLDHDLQAWIQRTPEHAFSLAIRVTDESKIKDRPKLYEELQAVNTLEVVNNNITDLDQDLEADA